MKRANLFWTMLFVAGAIGLTYRAAFTEHGMGKVFVKRVAEPAAPEPNGAAASSAGRWVQAQPRIDPAAVVSIPRTAGLWLSAFFTLAVLSFLYRDNVFYKLSESVFVGVTAGYLMAVGFWDGIVDKLLANLMPGTIRNWALPELSLTAHPGPDWRYVVPLILGIMLLWRLAPRGGWISRWPMGLVVGTFAGLKLVNYLDADFVRQVQSTIVPLVVLTDGRIDLWASVRNVSLVVGVLSCLTYFFFSVEHRGLVGKAARVGVWFLMITFGASFAFTVMGRVALLAARIEFLLDDWLWLIDPTGKRPPGW